MFAACLILANGNVLDHVVAHDLFRIGPIVVSNHMLMVALTAATMLLVFPAVFAHRAMVPVGVSNFFEAICVYLREEVARPVLKEETDRFIGYLWTTFFFILFCNLLGLLPISGLISMATLGYVNEVGGAATGNIYVTGGLAASGKGCAGEPGRLAGREGFISDRALNHKCSYFITKP